MDALCGGGSPGGRELSVLRRGSAAPCVLARAAGGGKGVEGGPHLRATGLSPAPRPRPALRAHPGGLVGEERAAGSGTPHGVVRGSAVSGRLARRDGSGRQ